jgi:hypothetical protein
LTDELLKIAETAKVTPRTKEIYRKLLKLSPVDVKVTSEAKAFGGGFFDQKTRQIAVDEGKDWHALAHEIGHAELDKHILGRLIQHPIVRSTFDLVPILGGAAGVLWAKGKKWGVLLPLAATVPTLLSEAMATSRGKKKLEEIDLRPKEMDAYQHRLRSAFLSYGAKPLSAAAFGGLFHAMVKH